MTGVAPIGRSCCVCRICRTPIRPSVSRHRRWTPLWRQSRYAEEAWLSPKRCCTARLRRDTHDYGSSSNHRSRSIVRRWRNPSRRWLRSNLETKDGNHGSVDASDDTQTPLVVDKSHLVAGVRPVHAQQTALPVDRAVPWCMDPHHA